MRHGHLAPGHQAARPLGALPRVGERHVTRGTQNSKYDGVHMKSSVSQQLVELNGRVRHDKHIFNETPIDVEGQRKQVQYQRKRWVAARRTEATRTPEQGNSDPILEPAGRRRSGGHTRSIEIQKQRND
jgi:hypothetical protein